MKKTLHFFAHIGVFLIIEMIFVLIIFREVAIPSNLSTIGVLHISFWIMLFFAGWFRLKVSTVWERFIADYIPVLYHGLIHIAIGMELIEIHSHSEAHMHDHHSMIWMIVSIILLGILIFVGEYLLHKKIHCETHHDDSHTKCHDKDCECEHK